MELHAEAAQLYRAVSDQPGVATTLEYLAGVLLSIGQPESAARLLGTADAVRQLLGAAPAEHERLHVLHVQAGLRDALGGAGLDTVLAHGRGTTADQVLDLLQRVVAEFRGGQPNR